MHELDPLKDVPGFKQMAKIRGMFQEFDLLKKS